MLSVLVEPTSRMSSRLTARIRSSPMVATSLKSTTLLRLWPTQWLSSFSTSMSWLRSAWMYSCSAPFLSSMRISLKFAGVPPLLERLFIPL
ncbi:hypothetical protein D3C76_1284010 [compost metagenome]